ncbi:uncharacterized protein LOC117167214 isoform X2 [Belonocnema kinseyi]|uniref:uncharacterized protein LOC117167214 isoform X2 n=1 Tax=Belonocnema kinseyi TaxID=2817044 RepID=UPI00143D2F3B|nr:uncharacterized protein LOC117167214 isoform X2 [Belonocnema kinseyi]
MFKEVLKRCHKYVKTIDLNTTIRDAKDDELGLYHSLPSLSIHDICQLCPNLRCLYLNEIQIHPSRKLASTRKRKYKHTSGSSRICSTITSQMIQALIQHSENFTHFSLNLQRHDYSSDCISNLITRMKNLKMLHLNSGSKLPGEILMGLSFETIEEIFLEECKTFWTLENADLLNTVLQRCTNLDTFVLNDSIQGANVDLCRLKHLKNLGLIKKMRDSNQLRCVLQLHNLQRLNVQANNSVDDQFLKQIFKNCRQLVYLNISRLPELNESFVLESSLPNRKCLH